MKSLNQSGKSLNMSAEEHNQQTTNQEEIKSLMFKLESHLNSKEHSLKLIVKVTSESSEAELDDLFLSNDYSKNTLINGISIIKQKQDQSQIILENKCFDEATKRLKLYVESLNEHIIQIIESESEEFLQVSGKLERLKDMMGHLRESVREFHKVFQNEKEQTSQAFSYLGQQYTELVALMKERDSLEQLVEKRNKFIMIQTQIKNLASDVGNDYYIEYEECARTLKLLRVGSSSDSQMNTELALLEKELAKKLNDKFYNFIHKQGFFKANEVLNEEDLYFNQCELASLLRVYKLMENQKHVYDQIQILILKPQLNLIVKKAFEAKQYQNLAAKDDAKYKLPFDIFTNGIMTEIVNGSLKGVLQMTWTDHSSYNYVAGYDFVKECLWPLIITNFDSSLSFVYSTGNLLLFQRNFIIAKAFNRMLRETCNQTLMGQELLAKFNVQTYLNVLIIENTDRYQQELDKQFDATNDSIKPLHHITLAYSQKVLAEGFYLSEIGDKLIKMSTQFIVRHLNFVMDKVNEKRSMGTERILFILEDLTSLQHGIETQVRPLIIRRIVECQPSMTSEDVDSRYVKAIMTELQLRFDYLTDPCLQGIGNKIQTRFSENLQSFKSLPQQFRMTSKALEQQPSAFLNQMLRPLQNLSEQKQFSQLSQGVKLKLYESVIKSGFKDLQQILSEILNEESKMHESLKKYKKDDSSTISDFEKLQVQFYMDVKELERQIRGLYGDEYREERFFNQLGQIYQLLAKGKQWYDKLYEV